MGCDGSMRLAEKARGPCCSFQGAKYVEQLGRHSGRRRDRPCAGGPSGGLRPAALGENEPNFAEALGDLRVAACGFGAGAGPYQGEGVL